jgi:hypothetical protein
MPAAQRPAGRRPASPGRADVTDVLVAPRSLGPNGVNLSDKRPGAPVPMAEFVHLDSLRRNHHDATNRKHADIALLERVTQASRAQLEQECDEAGLPHAGRSDDNLRRFLLAWLRQEVAQPLMRS